MTGGGNYTSDPTVTISGGGGSGATATVTRTNPVVGQPSANIIYGITLGEPGSGYTQAPTVTLNGGGYGPQITAATFSVALSPPTFVGASNAPKTKLATTLTTLGASNVTGMVYNDLLVPDVNVNLGEHRDPRHHAVQYRRGQCVRAQHRHGQHHRRSQACDLLQHLADHVVA